VSKNANRQQTASSSCSGEYKQLVNPKRVTAHLVSENYFFHVFTIVVNLCLTESGSPAAENLQQNGTTLVTDG